ncbi:hypothetical protein Hamer_G018876, partial [Homarus americanus]
MRIRPTLLLFLVVADYEHALSLICYSALKNSVKQGQVSLMSQQWSLMCSLKSSTRERRGTRTRRGVMSSGPLPRTWPKDGKVIIVRNGQDVLCVQDCVDLSQLAPCSHKEADTRNILYCTEAASKDHNRILVRTVDTDVVVLAIGTYHMLAIPASLPTCICHGTRKSKSNADVPCHNRMRYCLLLVVVGKRQLGMYGDLKNRPRMCSHNLLHPLVILLMNNWLYWRDLLFYCTAVTVETKR